MSCAAGFGTQTLFFRLMSTKGWSLKSRGPSDALCLVHSVQSRSRADCKHRPQSGWPVRATAGIAHSFGFDKCTSSTAHHCGAMEWPRPEGPCAPPPSPPQFVNHGSFAVSVVLPFLEGHGAGGRQCAASETGSSDGVHVRPLCLLGTRLCLPVPG